MPRKTGFFSFPVVQIVPCINTTFFLSPAAKKRRPSEADYESGGDKDYDLSDPFIDDSEEDSIEDEDDEDYVPDVNDEVDPDLLKDDQWKASAGDAPEVLELLKDARDYLRNKKL